MPSAASEWRGQKEQKRKTEKHQVDHQSQALAANTCLKIVMTLQRLANLGHAPNRMLWWWNKAWGYHHSLPCQAKDLAALQIGRMKTLRKVNCLHLTSQVP